MRSWIARVDRFWFQPAPAERLAALRILIGGYLLWVVFYRSGWFLEMARTNAAFFQPVGVASLLSAPLDVAIAQRVFWATAFFNVCFIVGFKHRYTGPMYAFLMAFVLSYKQSWSMVYHSLNLPVLHIFILGVTPSADAYSLDSLIRKRTSSRLLQHGSWPHAESREGASYGWTIKLIGTVTLLTYFLAGVAKVAGPLGWSWATGAALRDQIAVDGLRKELLASGASPWVFTLYEHTYFLAMFAVGTLVVELGAPLVVAHARTAQFWAVAVFAMHWGVYAVMDIQFRYQLCGAAFLSFFPVEKVPRALGAIARQGRRAIIGGVPSR